MVFQELFNLIFFLSYYLIAYGAAYRQNETNKDLAWNWIWKDYFIRPFFSIILLQVRIALLAYIVQGNYCSLIINAFLSFEQFRNWWSRQLPLNWKEGFITFRLLRLILVLLWLSQFMGARWSKRQKGWWFYCSRKSIYCTIANGYQYDTRFIFLFTRYRFR